MVKKTYELLDDLFHDSIYRHKSYDSEIKEVLQDLKDRLRTWSIECNRRLLEKSRKRIPSRSVDDVFKS